MDLIYYSYNYLGGNYMNGNYYENGYTNNINDSIINVLKENIGKKVRLSLTIPNKEDKTYNGIIEKVGDDYLILSDPTNGEWQLFLMIYLGFVTFEERVNY